MDTVAKLQCYRSRGDNRHPTTVIRYAWTLELCQEHCPQQHLLTSTEPILYLNAFTTPS